jgi:hypothetical protein
VRVGEKELRNTILSSFKERRIEDNSVLLEAALFRIAYTVGYKIIHGKAESFDAGN